MALSFGLSDVSIVPGVLALAGVFGVFVAHVFLLACRKSTPVPPWYFWYATSILPVVFVAVAVGAGAWRVMESFDNLDTAVNTGLVGVVQSLVDGTDDCVGLGLGLSCTLNANGDVCEDFNKFDANAKNTLSSIKSAGSSLKSMLGSLTVPIYGLCASLALGWIGYGFSRLRKNQIMICRLLAPFAMSGLVGIVCIQGSSVIGDVCAKMTEALLESDDFLVYIDPKQQSDLFTKARDALSTVCPTKKTLLVDLLKPGLVQAPYTAATTAVCTDAKNSFLVFGVFLILAAVTPGLADVAAQRVWSATQQKPMTDSEVAINLLTGTSKL